MYNQSFVGLYQDAARRRALLQDKDYLGRNDISPENAEMYDNALRAQQGQAVVGGIITGLTGATTLLSNAYKDAQIRDTSMQEGIIADLNRAGNYNYNNYDQLANDYAQTNFNPRFGYQDIRGMTKAQQIGSVGTSALSGAATGLQIGGPWGCVCAGTRVMTNDGRFVDIENLTKEDGIIGWNGSCSVQQSIYDFQTPAQKECIELTFDNGDILRCSVDHPILYHKPGRNHRQTIDGKRYRIPEWAFMNAEDLHEGDWVASSDELSVFGSENYPEARLLGLLIGDGTYGKDHGVRLFSEDSIVWEYIESNNLGYRLKDFTNHPLYVNEFRAYKIANGPELLRRHGIYGQTKENKRLPDDIHLFSRKALSEFIAGLFDTDGCVPNCFTDKEHRIEFAQSNKELLYQLKEQLLKFGIHSYIRKTNSKHGNIHGRDVVSKPGFKLIIKDAESVLLFRENIPLLISYKNDHLSDAKDYKISVVKRRPRYNGIYPVRVKSVKSIGMQTIYNLQADDSHTYIANGIITHNSLIGGVVGLGTGLGGVLTGDAIARTKQNTLNIQAGLASDAARQNFAAAHERIGDNIHRQNAVNAVAKGGPIKRQTIAEYADKVLKKNRTYPMGTPISRSFCNGGLKVRIKVK